MKNRSNSGSEDSRNDVPKSWEADPLSEFLAGAHENILLTFKYHQDVFHAFLAVDGLFIKMMKVKFDVASPFIPLFLSRSHSAFRGATRLALSAQVVESYMVTRGCLENALYGYYVGEQPELSHVWADRLLNEKGKKECRKQFAPGKILKLLTDCDGVLGGRASKLYDLTIDYGAHPNVVGHLTTSEVREDGGTTNQLMPGSRPAWLALRTVFEVGLTSIRILLVPTSGRLSDPDVVEQMKRLERVGFPTNDSSGYYRDGSAND